MVFGGSNFNLVSYVLYSIVATVDILSRYYRILQQSDRLALEDELGSLAAAYTVAWSSVTHMIVVFTVEPLKKAVWVHELTGNTKSSIIWGVSLESREGVYILRVQCFQPHPP